MPAVERHGQALHFQRKAQKKPLALLMALVSAGGRQVSAALLAGELWPDADGDAARNALTITLFRLRHLLECQEAVVLSDGRLSLDPQRVWLDTWNFEALFSVHRDGKLAEDLVFERR